MHQKLILDKISDILSATDDSYDAKLIGLCEGAKRIFVAGAGRDARKSATLSDIFRFIRSRLSTGRFSPRIMRRTSAVRANACSTPNA